jgi:glutamine amidotransferase
MQWNVLDPVTPATRADGTALLAGLDDPAWVYFVHSYAAEPDEHTVATCDYGGPLAAAVVRDTVWATQFHPEKSGRAGMQILTNFVLEAAQQAAA